MRLLLLALAIFGFQSQALAQDSEIRRIWEHESSDVPVDPRVHFGNFTNGIRYAWVDNSEPNERCYVRLHVNVGSLSENASEAGMAHFLEHMAFNGSEHFPAGTLIEWFQNNGMSFGADTNAHTGFSETVYKLDLPNSDEKTVASGLQVLRDFGFGLLLEEKEVEAEKGVIDGEQRERDSASYRVLIHGLQKTYEGTLFPDRLPIGTEEIRSKFTATTIRQFYQKWYRPENMTLVVVGDLKGMNPVSLMEKAFADVNVPPIPWEKEPALGTPSMEDLFFTLYEPEIPTANIRVEMLNLFVAEPYTREEILRDIPISFAHSMLNLRYRELQKKKNSPFLSASVSEAGGLKVFEGGSLSLNTEPGKWKEGLLAAEDELRRALKFGFQQVELEEVRANYLLGLKEAIEREPTQHSRSILGGILSACEEAVVPTDAQTDFDIFNPAIENLTTDVCWNALKEEWKGGQLAMSLTGNVNLGETGPAQLKAVHEKGRSRKLEPPSKINSATFAYHSSSEKAGEIVARQFHEDLGLHTIQFANGVAINVKQTDFKEKHVGMIARVGEGQLSADPKTEAVIAWVAGHVFSPGGLGQHSIDDMRRLFAGKQVGVRFSIDEDAFVLSGSTVSEDLLLQMELACAWLTDPGYRPDGLNQIHPRMPLVFQQMEHQVQGPLMLEFLPELHSGDLRFIPLPPLEDVLAVTMDDIRGFLTEPLAKGPLEVTFVGDLNIEQVIAFAAQTFGTLAPRRARQEWPGRRTPVPIKKGVLMNRSVVTQIPQALVTLVFPTDDGLDTARRRNLSFLGGVLHDRLRLEVREKLGAAYSPGAQADASSTYQGIGSIVIQAQADPAHVETLVEACKNVAKNLAEKGITQEELDRLVEPELASLRDAMRTNSWWLSGLYDAQSNPSSLADIRGITLFFNNLSRDDISKLAKEFLKPESASILVVIPELPTPVEASAEAPPE